MVFERLMRRHGGAGTRSGSGRACARWAGRHDGAMTDLHLAQDPDADALLSRDPLALLLGMLLDQHLLSRRNNAVG